VIASNLGIKINVETFINEDIKVKPVDLCSVFSNLIDNAIDACNNISDSSLIKFIEVMAGLKQDYLIIKISNSKENEIMVLNSKIVTTKADKNIHGLGLNIVKEIASKYDGNFKTVYTENDFTATVWLNTKASLVTAV
jgi:sensor histidine kinase regulating citrate/malate metabolism